MKIYCIDEFRKEYGLLIKNKSYKSLENLTITHFSDKTIDELRSGRNLNQSQIVPFIKHRLGGSGGFRVYYILLLKDDCVYLAFVHPKTGSKGAENISVKSISNLQKKVLEAIASKSLYEIIIDKKTKKIKFSKVKKLVTNTL